MGEAETTPKTSFQHQNSSFRSSLGLSSVRGTDGEADIDQNALQWAAIERLPTYDRLRSSLFDKDDDDTDATDNNGKKVIDVTKFGALERIASFHAYTTCFAESVSNCPLWK